MLGTWDAFLLLYVDLRRWLTITLERPGDVIDLLMSKLWAALST